MIKYVPNKLLVISIKQNIYIIYIKFYLYKIN